MSRLLKLKESLRLIFEQLAEQFEPKNLADKETREAQRALAQERAMRARK